MYVSVLGGVLESFFPAKIHRALLSLLFVVLVSVLGVGAYYTLSARNNRSTAVLARQTSIKHFVDVCVERRVASARVYLAARVHSFARATNRELQQTWDGAASGLATQIEQRCLGLCTGTLEVVGYRKVRFHRKIPVNQCVRPSPWHASWPSRCASTPHPVVYRCMPSPSGLSGIFTK